MWAILFVTGIVTACLFAGVSVLMRMRFPDKSRPEWMLAGLIVLGVFADLVQPRVCTRLGRGCARNAWIQCHFRSHCRIFDR